MQPQRASATDPAAPSLAIFDPGSRAESPHDLDGPHIDPWGELEDIAETYTVEDYYREFIQPRQRTRATLEEYALALRRWTSFCDAFPIPSKLPQRAENNRIHYPVLASVTSRALAGFQRWLVGEGVPARATNKTVGAIRAIVAKAAKRGVLSVAPSVEKLAERSAATIYTLSHVEFSRAYHACDVAAWPTTRRSVRALALPYDPPTGWRALLVLLVTYGMRTEDAAAYTSDASPLTWSNVRRDPMNPHPAGKNANPHGWLVFTPRKTEAKKPEPLILPLTALVRWHLDRLDPMGTAKPEDLVFDWPCTAGNVAKERQGYYLQFSRIFAAAGVHPRDWSGNPIDYKPNHLRKTCVTWHENNLPGASQYITGHASNRSPDATLTAVQRRHYFNAETLTAAALASCPILAGWGVELSN